MTLKPSTRNYEIVVVSCVSLVPSYPGTRPPTPNGDSGNLDLPSKLIGRIFQGRHYGGFIQVYTKDHQQLDGMVVYEGAAMDKSKPVVVMCLGNGMLYEDVIYYAKDIARNSHVNVLLYNPRGVGLSLGEEFTLDEAVEDCKAVIKYAQNELCGGDARRLGVFGLSLGGGISAEALKQLQGEKQLKKIGLYINQNSFPSLHKFAEGSLHLNPLLGRIALAIVGLNPLNSGHTLATRKLAKHTTVITAEHDEVMTGPGCLSDYLQSVLSSQNTTNKKAKEDVKAKHEDLDDEICLSSIDDKKPNIKIRYHQEPNAHHNSWNLNHLNSVIQHTFIHEDEIDQLQL